MSNEPTQMRALQLTAYGGPSVLKLASVPIPRPAHLQIRVRITHSSINPAEWKIRRGNFPLSLKLPSTLGGDFAGEVVEVGKDIGDQVRGTIMLGTGQGTYSEYITINPSKDHVAKRPPKLSSADAAAAGTAGLTSFYGLFSLGLLPRSITPPGSRRVLILGASGGTGVFAVQFAKLAGAYVVGVCSGKNIEYVREMGADRVIDYTQQAFKKELANEEQFDVVLDLVGGDDYYYRAQSLLKKAGRYVTACATRLIFDGRYKQIVSLPVKEFGEMVKFLEEAGDKFKGAVTQTYALEDGAKAQEASEKGVRGKISLKI
ncbi:uncharacterized protein VTP21DRAFT_7516 [Calcarisporiella thermophila]|uniref:uncharacterized protein n=1 Tax=Calcarisporiella thermophila TaxID=911321 RepID=UPI003743288B